MDELKILTHIHIIAIFDVVITTVRVYMERWIFLSVFTMVIAVCKCVLYVNYDSIHRHCTKTGEKEKGVSSYGELIKTVEHHGKKDLDSDKKQLLLSLSRMFNINATGNLTNVQNVNGTTTRDSVKLSHDTKRFEDANDTFGERCKNIKQEERKRYDSQHKLPLKQVLDTRNSNCNSRAETNIKMGSLVGICKSNNNTGNRNLRIQCKICGLFSRDIFDALQHKSHHDLTKNRKPEFNDVRTNQSKVRRDNGSKTSKQTQIVENCEPHRIPPPTIQHPRRNSPVLPTVRSPSHNTEAPNNTSQKRKALLPTSRRSETPVMKYSSPRYDEGNIRISTTATNNTTSLMRCDNGNSRRIPTMQNLMSEETSTVRQCHQSKQKEPIKKNGVTFDLESNRISPIPPNYITDDYLHRSFKPLKSILKKSSSCTASTPPRQRPNVNVPIRRESSVPDVACTTQHQSLIERVAKPRNNPSNANSNGYHTLPPNHVHSVDELQKHSKADGSQFESQNSRGNNGSRYRLPSPLKLKNSPYNRKNPNENKVNWTSSPPDKLSVNARQLVNNNPMCQQNRGNLSNTKKTPQKDVRENHRPVQSVPKYSETVRLQRKRSSEENYDHRQKVQKVANGISKTPHGVSKNSSSETDDHCWPFNVSSESPPPSRCQNECNVIRVSHYKDTLSSSAVKPVNGKPHKQCPVENIKVSQTRSEEYGSPPRSPSKAADREVTVFGKLPQCSISSIADQPKSIFDNCPLRPSAIPKPQVATYQALRVQIPNVFGDDIAKKTEEKKAEKHKIDHIEDETQDEKRKKLISVKRFTEIVREKAKKGIKEPTTISKVSEEGQSPSQKKKCCFPEDNGIHKKLKEQRASDQKQKVTENSPARDVGVCYQHKINGFKKSRMETEVCRTSSKKEEKQRSLWDDLCWNSTKDPVNQPTKKNVTAAKVPGYDTDSVDKKTRNSSSPNSGSRKDVVRFDIVQSVINPQEHMEQALSSCPTAAKLTIKGQGHTNTEVGSETIKPDLPIIRKKRATARKSIRNCSRQQAAAIIKATTNTSESTCICHVCKKTVPSSQRELYVHWSEGSISRFSFCERNLFRWGFFPARMPNFCIFFITYRFSFLHLCVWHFVSCCYSIFRHPEFQSFTG